MCVQYYYRDLDGDVHFVCSVDRIQRELPERMEEQMISKINVMQTIWIRGFREQSMLA